MPSEKSITWLGRGAEKRALGLCTEHIDKIVEATKNMRKTVYSFADDGKKVNENQKKVFKNEEEADEKKEQVLDELSKENFPPFSREMIVRFIMTTDDIADNAGAAALKLSFLDPADIDREVKEGLKELSDLAYESATTLREAFETLLENPEETREKTEQVEELEEEADHFRVENLTLRIVKWANKIQKPGDSHILEEVEDNIEEVLDQAENSADVIREISISST